MLHFINQTFWYYDKYPKKKNQGLFGSVVSEVSHWLQHFGPEMRQNLLWGRRQDGAGLLIYKSQERGNSTSQGQDAFKVMTPLLLLGPAYSSTESQKSTQFWNH